MTPTQAAYLAGILDGEGSISLRIAPSDKAKRGWVWRPFIQVVNTDLSIIDFVNLVTASGCAYTYQPKTRHWKLRGVWHSTSACQLLVWLPEVLPYLVAKRTNAELLLEGCRLIAALPSRFSPQYAAAFEQASERLMEIYDALEAIHRTRSKGNHVFRIGAQRRIAMFKS